MHPFIQMMSAIDVQKVTKMPPWPDLQCKYEANWEGRGKQVNIACKNEYFKMSFTMPSRCALATYGNVENQNNKPKDNVVWGQ